MKVNFVGILKSLGKAQSIISPRVGAHQQQVAYLSYRIAQQLKLTQEQQTDLLIAGLLHDIGALSLQEQEAAITEQLPDVNTHAFRGAYLISGLFPGKNISQMIQYHHYYWHYGRTLMEYPNIPYGSQILHLADRISAYISDKRFILSQIPDIKTYITKNSGEFFHPEYADAFLSMADWESLWLDLVSAAPLDRVDKPLIASSEMSIDDLVELARVYSHLIDFRSPFTATHSASVAQVAQGIAERMHFSPTECKEILIAGYLHDLGKLTVDNRILEKQSSLTTDEFDIIRSHSYYTYYLLDDIEAFDQIKRWAAYHHERLNGNGYPFHLGESDLPLGARIMAVADVFSALQEKRPYKEEMQKNQITSILFDMVRTGSLDSSVVEVLTDNFSDLSEVCTQAKMTAEEEFNELYRIGGNQPALC